MADGVPFAPLFRKGDTSLPGDRVLPAPQGPRPAQATEPAEPVSAPAQPAVVEPAEAQLLPDQVQPRPRPVADSSARPRPRAARPAPPPTQRGDIRFTPPVPETAPRSRPSNTPLNAPIAPAVDLSPFGRDPMVRVSPGAVLGAIESADVDANIVSTRGGEIHKIGVAPGTQLPIQLAVRNGVVTQARVDVLDARGRQAYLDGPVDIGGVDLTSDRRVVPRIRNGFVRFFADVFGMSNQTGAIFSGQRRVPVDPNQFFKALGFGDEIALLGPRAGAERPPSAELAELRRIIDAERSPVQATVSLSPSRELVRFGEGLQLQLGPGSTATYSRQNGLDRVEINANVLRARFGVENGPNVETGQASMRIIAQQVEEGGRRRWVVNVVNDGQRTIQGVRLRTPVTGERATNELNLGNVSISNGNQPVITLDRGKLTVGFDTQLDGVNGALHLRDQAGRRGVLTLGNARSNDLRVAARVDLTTSTANPTAIERLAISADTNGLNLGLTAPDGVQVAAGEGFGFGVQSGTQLAGNGRITYSMGGDQPTNFTLESRDGVRAVVNLFGTKVDRSLGDIGIRTDVRNGARLEASVQKLDWATGAVEMRAEFDATLDRAAIRLPSGEQAAVSNASGIGRATISYRPGDLSPEVRGALRLAIETTGNGTREMRPGFSFLPRNVPGFDRANAEAGVQLEVSDGGATFDMPFTVHRTGAFETRNGDTSGATLSFERLAIDSVFNTNGAREQELNVNLPMRREVDDAERRHQRTDADLPLRAIPPLLPRENPSPRDAFDDVVGRINVGELFQTGLREVDLDLTIPVRAEHTFVTNPGSFMGPNRQEVTLGAGSIRLVLESDGGRVTPQLATRPDGTPNPTVGLPSGITFDPPLRMTWNPSRDGHWWNTPFQSTLEVHGVDVVPSPSNPDQIVLRPRLGNADFGAAGVRKLLLGTASWADPVLGTEDMVNRMLTESIMETATGSKEIPTTVQELAARIARHANVKIDTRADIVRRVIANAGPQHADFVRDTFAGAQLAARAQLNPGSVIRVGQDQLTIASAEDVRVVRRDGRTEVTAQVTLGDTVINGAGGAQIALKGVSARLRLVQSGQGTDQQTSIELTDVAAPELSFTQADRQSYTIRQGGARRIFLNSTGAVTVEGLAGTFSGNMLYNGSQVYVEQSRLTNGSLQLDPAGGLRSAMQLTDVQASATNIEIPAESNDPAASGVAAHLRQIDIRAPAATLNVTPDTGIQLTTPPTNRASVAAVADRASFVFPSPRMHVQVTNARASGTLQALHIGPTTKRIQLYDWYLDTSATNGSVSGTVVAGPPGSQAANLQIEPMYTDAEGVQRRSRIRVFIASLGFTQANRDQRVDAVIAGRIDSAFSLPEREIPSATAPQAPQTYLHSSGRFQGTIDFSMRSKGRPIDTVLTSADAPSEIAAQAHVELSLPRDAQGRVIPLVVEGALNPTDARDNARVVKEEVVRRWNLPTIAPRPAPRDHAQPAPTPAPRSDADAARERARLQRAEEQRLERVRRREEEQQRLTDPLGADRN